MSGVTKDTIQKILLLALAAMTVSMIFISIYNYNDHREKDHYLENEKVLVTAELNDIIKNYDHLYKQKTTESSIVKSERKKAKELLKQIEHSVLDYESIISYRKQLFVLRKTNRQLQRKLDGAMHGGTVNAVYF